MNVDLYHLQKALFLIRHVNATPLSEIVWMLGGKAVPVDGSLIAEWKYIGMSNVEFAKVAGLVDGADPGEAVD